MSAAAPDLSSLERLRVSALLQEPEGRPLELRLDAIDFDPMQPRRHFDAQRLEELAATIRECGVIQPISVRANPLKAGRYIVNVGERRVRASRLAGRQTIPAWVEGPIDPYARVIENLAREALTPFELARFVAEREAAGENRRQIAQRLGKAAPFISEVSALIDAPEAVRRIHDAGRCADVRVLYQLCRLYRTDAAKVQVLSEEDGPVTRERIRSLEARPVPRLGLDSGRVSSTSRPRRKRANAFLVDIGGRLAFMPVKIPASMSAAQVVYEDGSRETVELGRIRLIQWTTLQ